MHAYVVAEVEWSEGKCPVTRAIIYNRANSPLGNNCPYLTKTILRVCTKFPAVSR